MIFGLLKKMFGGGQPAESAGSVVKDPICGMEVDPQTAKAKVELGGKTFYFCSENCRQRFAKKLKGEDLGQESNGHCH